MLMSTWVSTKCHWWLVQAATLLEITILLLNDIGNRFNILSAMGPTCRPFYLENVKGLL